MIIDNSTVRPIFYRIVVNPLYKFLLSGARIHPNSITLIGFLIVAIAFLSIFMTPHERWLHLLTSIAIFLYAIADHFDGLHARRTDRCSPFGELLDHFCDFWVGFALLIMVYLANSFDFNTLLIFSILYAISFVASHVEHIRTFNLHFGRVGPLEGVIGISFYFLMSALFNSLWVQGDGEPTVAAYFFISLYAVGFF